MADSREEYLAKKRERERLRRESWTPEQREHHRARSREWNKNNIEKRRLKANRYRAANLEKVRASSRKWEAANPDRIKERRLRRAYNLTLTDWNRMMAFQGGCCAVCKRPSSDFKNGLAVDHDHTTRLVRGMLCWPCNTLIPARKDVTDKFRRLLAYLLNPPAVTALGEQRFANAMKRKKKKRKTLDEGVGLPSEPPMAGGPQ